LTLVFHVLVGGNQAPPEAISVNPDIDRWIRRLQIAKLIPQAETGQYEVTAPKPLSQSYLASRGSIIGSGNEFLGKTQQKIFHFFLLFLFSEATSVWRFPLG
jgi:hypothetical protein